MNHDKQLKTMSEVFKALSDPTRLKILLLLLSFKKLCVNSIADKIGLTQPAISQQLKILRNAKVIDAQKVGLYVHYSINNETIGEYIGIFNNLYRCNKKQSCVKCPK
jgi:DNA-binding transcriptional ArsR family regulator